MVTVSNMETKVVKQIQEKPGKQSKRRCRHYNAGYCKLKGDCTYYHSDKVCDPFLTDGKCANPKLCLLKHPKECKFWLGDRRGCLRGQECNYLHTTDNKGKNVKESANENQPDNLVTETIVNSSDEKNRQQIF